MTENVAGLHCGHYAVVRVEVRSANGSRGDFDEYVARRLNFRLRDRLYPDIVLAVPNQSFHDGYFLFAEPGSAIAAWAFATNGSGKVYPAAA